MKSYYKRKQFIATSHMDSQNKLSLQACMGFLQDISTEHCIPLGFEHANFLATRNAFWVITKVKLHIFDMPTAGDTVKLETFMVKPTAVRFERDCIISRGKKVLVSAKMEWVVLDADTHRPRSVKSIDYPTNLKYKNKRAMEDKFQQISASFTPQDLCYSRTVYLGDTDLNFHVNNCVYNRFVLDCFSTEELKSKNLTDYEIHFISECVAGVQLDFYRKDEENESIIEARCADKPIIRAKLVFVQK